MFSIKEYRSENKEEIADRIEEKRKYSRKIYQNHREDRKKYREFHKERTKSYNLKRKYNISIKEITRLIILQNNKCGICEEIFTGVRPHAPCVDHVHGTKIVRGLLCNNCNSGIGFFNDDPEIIKNAIKWLKEKGSSNENS